MNQSDKDTLKTLRARIYAGEQFNATLLARYQALAAQAAREAGGQTMVVSNGLLSRIYRIKEEAFERFNEEYSLLKCDDNFKLSTLLAGFPNAILVRNCSCAIFDLIIAEIERKDPIDRFVITGTPGVGKTVSLIILVYLIVRKGLALNMKTIIVDLPNKCIVLSRRDDGTWEEEWWQRDQVWVPKFPDSSKVLYLYDASYGRRPLYLPFSSVVFSSPNLEHFKDFIKTIPGRRKVYYTPKWQWREIDAFFSASTTLQHRTSLEDLYSVFLVWGGVPRQIFGKKCASLKALDDAIDACHLAAEYIKFLEKGICLDYTERGISTARSSLMHFDVENEVTYEKAMVNFGSSVIRDRMIEASGKSFTDYYSEFMKAHGSSDYCAKVRGNLYEHLVLDKLRNTSAGKEYKFVSFIMEKDKPNTPLAIMTIPAIKEHQVYSDLKDIKSLNRVWVPQQSNFKSFDVLVAPPGGTPPMWIQITAGKKHPLNVTGVHECLDMLKKTFAIDTAVPDTANIVFCLPPDVFKVWHTDNGVQNFVTNDGKIAMIHPELNNRKQIVLCIPGNEVEAHQAELMMTELMTEQVETMKIAK